MVVFLKLDPSPLCCHVTSYMKVQFSKHSSLWDHISEILVSEGVGVSEVGGRRDSEGMPTIVTYIDTNYITEISNVLLTPNSHSH